MCSMAPFTSAPMNCHILRSSCSPTKIKRVLSTWQFGRDAWYLRHSLTGLEPQRSQLFPHRGSDQQLPGTFHHSRVVTTDYLIVTKYSVPRTGTQCKAVPGRELIDRRDSEEALRKLNAQKTVKLRQLSRRKIRSHYAELRCLRPSLMHHVRQGWTEMLSSVQQSRVCQFKLQSHTRPSKPMPRRFICMQVCFLAQR